MQSTVCAKPRELSTAKNTTSNLKKHLDRVHANTKLTERDNAAGKRKAEDEGMNKRKQQKLRFSGMPVMLEPQEVRRLMAEYVVEDMQPLSNVESKAFRKLVSKIPIKDTNDKVS